jgi:hypothetical protein
LHVDASEVQAPVSMTGTSATLESLGPLDEPELLPLLLPLLLLAVESVVPPSWLLGAGLLSLLLLLHP